MTSRRTLWISVLLLGVGGAWQAPAGDDARSVFGRDLAARVEHFVRDRLEGSPSGIRVPDLSSFLPEEISPQAVKVQLSMRSPARSTGSVPVTVALAVSGREVKRSTITARVVEQRAVWVARRPLEAGARIGADDLRRATLDSARVPRDAATHRSALIGQRTRRSVREGAVWRASLVERVPAVERGQLVRLRVEHGALRIETRGRAREDGHRGDWVRVYNLDSRREIVGRVGPDGVVDVSF